MSSRAERTVFVGGTRNANEGHLESYFGRFGAIESVEIIRFPGGRSRGFGFIYFSESQSVSLALNNAYHTLGNGVRVNAKPYRPQGGSVASRPQSTPQNFATSRHDEATPGLPSLPPISAPVPTLSRSSESSPSRSTSAIANTEASSDLPLNVGERVVFLSDDSWEAGVVRWIGQLRLSNDDDLQHAGLEHAGLELDNANGTGTGKFGDRQLFRTPMNHATLVPLLGLLKEDDFYGLNDCAPQIASVQTDGSEAQGDDNVVNNDLNNNFSECLICCDREANSAFYKCGHSSQCYECAIACKNSRGVCPICQSPVIDVLKIYK